MTAGIFLACLLGLLIGAGSASAHAVVISTNPADGARLAKLPASVSIKFDEPVGLDLGYLRVVNASGTRVDTGNATHPDGDGTTIEVGIKSGTGDGTYLISWRVISADTHPVSGSIRFVVGNGALGVLSAHGGPTVSTTVSSSLAVIHSAGFAGITLLGGSWLVFALWPSGRARRAVGRVIWTGWGLAAVAAVLEFAIQGPYDAGGSLSQFWHSALLQATLHSSLGTLISLRLVLLGLLGAVLTAMLIPDDDLAQRRDAKLEIAAMLGVGVTVTYAASGHAQTANPRWFAIGVDALHLGAASVWLGGLVMLLVAGFGPPSDDAPAASAVSAADDVGELAARLPIFSRVAMASVATLAVTGTIQAWREVGAVDALYLTTYGRLVLAKIALFGLLVLLGSIARRHVQRGAAVPAVPAREVAVLGVGVGVLEVALPAREVGGFEGGGFEGGVLDVGASALEPAFTAEAGRDVGPPVVAEAGGPNTLRRLRRTMATEVVLGLVVLGVTGVLIAQPPGKAALDALHSRPKVSTVAVTATAKAVVDITPGKHGLVQVAVQLTGSISPTEVTATASLPAKDLGPLPVPLQLAGPKSYTASGVLLPSSGTWQITLIVQTSEFDSTTAVAYLRLS